MIIAEVSMMAINSQGSDPAENQTLKPIKNGRCEAKRNYDSRLSQWFNFSCGICRLFVGAGGARRAFLLHSQE